MKPERKTVIITGGASGIGSATGIRLRASGWNVIIADRQPPVAGATLLPGQVNDFIALDLSEPDAISMAFDLVAGPVHGLVCAAGVVESERLGQITAATWDRIHAINARAVLLVVQSLLHKFAEDAAIVIVTSLDGDQPVGMTGPTSPVYSASKAAATLIMRSLACDLGPRHIRVNAVAPGLTNTPMAANVDRQERAWIAAQTPLRRCAEPDDIAGPIAFLLGDEARYVTGVTLRVDGGLGVGVVRT